MSSADGESHGGWKGRNRSVGGACGANISLEAGAGRVAKKTTDRRNTIHHSVLTTPHTDHTQKTVAEKMSLCTVVLFPENKT